MKNGIQPCFTMLKGTNVRLRAYTKDDLRLATEYLNDLEIRSLMWPGIMFPLRMEDEQKWYESFHAMSDGNYHFAIERLSDDAYIGGCGINEVNHKVRSAEIGIFLGKSYLDQGYGTEAMQLLIDFCFSEINLNKLKLHVFSHNERAIHCYRKLGFQVEGTLREEHFRNGRYYDDILMGLLKREWKPLESNGASS